MQAFDPADRPTCQEALSDPYFHGLAQPQREPAAQPVSKLAFEFEKRKLHTTEVGAVRQTRRVGQPRSHGVAWLIPCKHPETGH